MKHIKRRIETAFNILFHHQHIIYIGLTSDTYRKHLSDEDIDINVVHIGLQKYGVYDLLSSTVKAIDDVEIILEKAKFEGEVEYRTLTNNPKGE